VNTPPGPVPAAYPRRVKARFPLFAALGVLFILVQDALARQGAVQAGVTVLIAALAALMLVLPRPERVGPRAVRVPLPLVLFVAFAAVRLASVPSKQGLQNMLVWFLFPAAMALVARRTSDGTPALVYRWWKPATLFAATVYGALVLVHQTGYAGTVYSARGMGWILLIAMSFVVGAQMWKSSVLSWPVWYLVVIIGTTLTRSASFLALLSATGIAVLSRRGRVTFLRFAALLGVMGLVGYLAVTQISVVRDRFTVGDQAVKFQGTGLNTSGRLQLWSATWHAIPEHPWIGHGPGQAQYFIGRRFITIDHPHNEYLRLLYDTGWIGLVLWSLGMLLLLRGCWRRTRRATNPVRRGVHLAGVLAILDFLLGSVTDNLTVGVAFVLICATVVGMSLGLPEDPSGDGARDPQDEAGTSVPTPAGRWTSAPPAGS
jgi:O-antigen ligase